MLRGNLDSQESRPRYNDNDRGNWVEDGIVRSKWKEESRIDDDDGSPVAVGLAD